MACVFLLLPTCQSQLATDEPSRSNRPFSDLASGRAPPTLPTKRLGSTSAHVFAVIGDVLSNEPAFVRVFLRKSSSGVVTPPSSEDSMSNGSTDDEPSELFGDSGEVWAGSIDPG